MFRLPRSGMLAVLSSVLILNFAGTSAAASRPNVLLILTDDQGYGDFSCHGNPHLHTPQIDKLAKASVRFDRFFVNSFCAPTRAALLTGRYPLRCGVWGVTHNKETMRWEEVTLGEALRSAGYRTACFGKWHNGEQFPYTPVGQGFDRFFGFHNGHINNYFDTELISGSRPVKTKGYISDVLTDEAIRFLSEKSDEPFFCYLAFNAPHSPFQVPDKYYDKFRAQGLPENVSAFYGMCENIDDNVGRILTDLEKQGFKDDTIVLFLTDNGGTAGVPIYNAGMRGGKTSVHEGGCRVPLFIRWPAGLPSAHDVKQITSHIDLYPTLLDLCGVKPPVGPKLDGISLRPLLENKTAAWPERAIFTHNPISQTNRYPGAVRTQQYRLVREIKGPQGGSSAKPSIASPWQLYDMRADPGEKQNLAESRPEVVKQLSAQYEAWMDDISQMPLERLPIQVGHEEENPVALHAPQAFFEGGLRFFQGPGFAHDWLTGWTAPKGRLWFEIDVVRAGNYEIELEYACPAKPDDISAVEFEVGENSIVTSLPIAEAPVIDLPHRDETGRKRYVNRDWGKLNVGTVSLSKGRHRLSISSLPKTEGEVMDFKSLTLKFTGRAEAMK